MTKESQLPLTEQDHYSEKELSVDKQLKSIESLVEIPYLTTEQKRAVLGELNNDIKTVLHSNNIRDRFALVRNVNDKMASITDSQRFFTEGLIEATQMAAQKLYAAGLFTVLETTEQERAYTREEIGRIYDAYFSTSDQLCEFTGGYNSELELFTLSRRSLAGRQCADSLRAGLVYDGTFGDISSSLETVWRTQRGAEGQLGTIASLSSLLQAAENEIYPTDSMQDAIKNQFQKIISDKDSLAFTRLYANRALEEALSRGRQEWVDLDELPLEEQTRLLELHETRQQQVAQEQKILHDMFQEFPQDGRLYRMAEDACVQIEQGDLGRLVMRDGREADLHRPEANATTLRLDTRDVELLKAAHDPTVLETITLETGLDMRMLPLDAQVKFFRFMAESKVDRYDHFCSTLNQLGDKRMIVAEAFLATEFGDSLGDSILTIANKGRENEMAFEVLQLISDIRGNVAEWEKTAWFAQGDSKYAEYFSGIKQAIEMRVSQILGPVPELMDGMSQEAQYFHRDGTVSETLQIRSSEEVAQGLKLLSLATRKIAQFESLPQSSRMPSFGEDYAAARALVDESPVRIMMRPYESNEAEARIRWSITVSPEEQMNIFGRYLEMTTQNRPRTSRISLRLDLEKISGLLSLDLGTRMEYGSGAREYPDKLLATLVTAGVQHKLRRDGEDVRQNDYHVRSVFPEKLSNPQVFGQFVESAQEHYIDSSKPSLGRVGVLNKVEAPSTVENRNIVYTGLFLDSSSVSRLHDAWPAELPNIPRNLHITTAFRPRELGDISPGENHVVKAVGVINDGQAQVLLIDSSDVVGVKNPHITIATGFNKTGKKISPAHSKKTIENAMRDNTVEWFSEPVELSTTSGYLDGKTGQIVLGVEK